MFVLALGVAGCPSDTDSEGGGSSSGGGEDGSDDTAEAEGGPGGEDDEDSGESEDPSGDSTGDESGEESGSSGTDGEGDSSTGEPAVCGDGVVEGDEECDDGNDDNNDDCLDTCAAASCGDGFIQAGVEACDDAGTADDDGCSSACEVELYSRCEGEGEDTVCSPINILYALANFDDEDDRVRVAAITGGSVDYFDDRSGAGLTLADTEGYDCVYSHPNNAYGNPAVTGETLAQFVDAGGNVVLGIATDFAPPTGLRDTTIMTEAYSPVTTAGGVTFNSPVYSGDGATVIHTDVAAYGLNLQDVGVALQGSGIADGTYTDGSISTAYRPDFKVVYFNGTGHGPFGPTGDWDRLLANACGAGFVQLPSE